MEFATETDKAALLIESELESIRTKFESGELKAFGICSESLDNEM